MHALSCFTFSLRRPDRVRRRGAVMVEAAIAAPILIGILLVTVWFAVLYSAKIDAVVTARAKTMEFASRGCLNPPPDIASSGSPTAAVWNDDSTASGLANTAVQAATEPSVAGCSEAAKKYNVATVKVTKAATMPIGRGWAASQAPGAPAGFLGNKTFSASSYALCNPGIQMTQGGLSNMGSSVSDLLSKLMK